jgi:hypothetical protein
MAEKSSRDSANRWQKLVSVWRNRKKISQIIKEYFYLPFCLLIILFSYPVTHLSRKIKMTKTTTLYLALRIYPERRPRRIGPDRRLARLSWRGGGGRNDGHGISMI